MNNKNLKSKDLLPSYNLETKKMDDIATEISNRKIGNCPVIQLRDISNLNYPFIYECKTFLDNSNIKNKKQPNMEIY